MTQKTHPTPRPGIEHIVPYVGGDVTPPKFRRDIALSSNENAFGPSPKAQEAMRAHLNTLHTYPSGNARGLCEEIARVHSLNPDQIVCGCGSEDLLQLLIRGYAGPGEEVLFSQHAFHVYEIAAFSAGATPVAVPAPNLTADLQAILEAVTPRTRVVLLDNPANPIGNMYPREEIEAFHRALPSDVLLILDAAYADYLSDLAYTPGADLVDTHENVVMTRTFSKFYGLAGLRIGWCYAPAPIVDTLHRIRPPFNASRIAQDAALASLTDTTFIQKVRDHYQKVLPWFMENLQRLEIDFIPSVTNFVLLRFPASKGVDPEKVYEHLGTNGIMTRRLRNYDLPECLRISLGTQEEMHKTLDCLEGFLKH